MKEKTRRFIVSLIVGLSVVPVVFLLAQQPAPADEQPAQPGLQLPNAPAPEKSRGIQYQEHRVGGRLERVTIIRENGFTEIYRNNRADTLWSAQENEIGEVPNMRQWILGTW